MKRLRLAWWHTLLFLAEAGLGYNRPLEKRKKEKKGKPNPCVWAFEWESVARGSGNKQNNGVRSTMKGTGIFFQSVNCINF